MNDPSHAAANSTALQTALNNYSHLEIPEGILYLSGVIDVSGGYTSSASSYRNIIISGMGRSATVISGTADIFSKAVNFTLQDLSITNYSPYNNSNNTPGKLVSLDYAQFTPGYNAPPSTGKSQFSNVEFGTANYHIWTNFLTVDWQFSQCHFYQAVVESRHFDTGCWVYKEFGCYTGYNQAGLHILGEVTDLALFGCVFEQTNDFAVKLEAQDGGLGAGSGGIYGALFSGVHFEVNGKALSHGSTIPSQDVMVIFHDSSQVRAVTFENCTFFGFSSDPSYTRVQVQAAQNSNGNISGLRFRGCYSQQPLGPNANYVTYDGCDFAPGYAGAYDQVLLPVLQGSGQNRSLGVFYYSSQSPNSGNGSHQVTSSVPGSANFAKISAKGTYYNGALVHTGYLEAVWSRTTNIVTVTQDINNTSGNNQGFTVQIASNTITVSNKSPMNYNQSGEAWIEYLS